uniref:uncharacterized protein LOC120332559 n=1 Tax=Styela clava TaxID=7725 RepID=UPI0019392D11|nr:uncharacterized protein LOC120332559 [Styela clava]
MIYKQKLLFSCSSIYIACSIAVVLFLFMQLSSKQHVETIYFQQYAKYSDQHSTSNENCPEYSQRLKGKLKVNSSVVPTEDAAMKMAGERVINGCYEPKDCHSNQTVAIIVPYKNRHQHLITLLHHLHPILQRQSLKYCVFVPEQYDDGAFNKGRIMNAGVLEILHEARYDFDCLVFHDVDMLLEDDRNLHICGDAPRHLCPAIDKFNYKVRYGTGFGGVGSIRVDQYKLVNGHSNRFYGWGGEDSDIECRFKLNGLKTEANDPQFGRYKMIPHEHPWQFEPKSGIGSHFQARDTKLFDMNEIIFPKSDPSGMNNMKYVVKNIFRHKLYTKINVDIRIFVVNKATVRFVGNSNKVIVENPFLTNDRLDNEKENSRIQGYGLDAGDQYPNHECTYKHFEGKTVNLTLGQKVSGTYDIPYRNLEEAKSKCSNLQRYCGSIVETSPGVYFLRSSSYLHENILKYKFGRHRQSIFTERHEDISVYVKICSRDIRYLQIFEAPVILQDEFPLKSIEHQAEVELLVYNFEDVKLSYSVSVYTAHNAILKEREAVFNTSLGIYDSLIFTYSSSVEFFSMSSSNKFEAVIGKSKLNMETLVEKRKSFRIKTPKMKLLLYPGCYVCESVIKDQFGSPHMKWKWWFEIRGATPDMEIKLLENNLRVAKVRSTKFTEKLTERLFQKYPSIKHLQIGDTAIIV